MATRAALHARATITGCWAGNEWVRAAGLGLPNSSRHEPATADTGFQSAITRSQWGRPCVGTKQLDTNAIGKRITSPIAWADSGSETASPRQAVNQLRA